MKDKYEYHKQNDYPGERKAEKKRVAERAVRDKQSGTGFFIMSGLLVLLLAGLGWGFFTMQQQSDQLGQQSNTIDAQSNELRQQSNQIDTQSNQIDSLKLQAANNVPAVVSPEVDQTDYQTARTVAENFVKNSATYRFDGSNLRFNKSITLSAQNCGGMVCYQFVYEFTSSHAGYNDRTGQDLPIVMTDHQIIATVRNGKIFQAFIDQTWNTGTLAPLSAT